jgi:hypothetical protein
VICHDPGASLRPRRSLLRLPLPAACGGGRFTRRVNRLCPILLLPADTQLPSSLLLQVCGAELAPGERVDLGMPRLGGSVGAARQVALDRPEPRLGDFASPHRGREIS